MSLISRAGVSIGDVFFARDTKHGHLWNGVNWDDLGPLMLGVPGVQGPVGAQGPTGPDGAQGPTGPQGAAISDPNVMMRNGSRQFSAVASYAAGVAPPTNSDNGSLADTAWVRNLVTEIVDAEINDTLVDLVNDAEIEIKVRLYEDNAQYAPSTGCVVAVVDVVGAGGGGGGSLATGFRGSGGGGGGAARKLIPISELRAEISANGPIQITVGKGGVTPQPFTTGDKGGPGGTTSFGDFCSATGGDGGGGGITSGSPDGVEGGEGIGGDLNFEGGASPRSRGTQNSPGIGGDAAWGWGMGGGQNIGGLGGRPTKYGGGACASNHTVGTFPTGADGVCVVYELIIKASL